MVVRERGMDDVVASGRDAGCAQIEGAISLQGTGDRRTDLSAGTILKIAVNAFEREGVAKLRVTPAESDHPRVS